jgi:hypothetical protein
MRPVTSVEGEQDVDRGPRDDRENEDDHPEQDHRGGAALGASPTIGATSVASTSASIERCRKTRRWL